MDLSLVPPALHEEAYRAIKERDAGALVYLASGAELDFVSANRWLLKDKGLLEPALITAFAACRNNNRRWQVVHLEQLFQMCEPDRLWEAGTEPPPGDRWVVYRGVAGKRGQRKVRGFSWTGSRDQACWYALRFNLLDPAVYSATVVRQDVYCITNARHEQEFICRPRRLRRLAITLAEMQEGQIRINETNTVEVTRTRLKEYLGKKQSKALCEALG